MDLNVFCRCWCLSYKDLYIKKGRAERVFSAKILEMNYFLDRARHLAGFVYCIYCTVGF